MVSKTKIGDVVWIDIDKPSKEEIEHLSTEFDIPKIIKEELPIRTLRSKIERFGDFFYFILHFPAPGCSRNCEQMTEIDFLISKNFLITVHYGKVATIGEYHQKISSEIALSSINAPQHGGMIFFELLKRFYTQISHRLNDFYAKLIKIEVNVFAGGREQKLVTEISEAKRELLDYKQSLRFHQDLLNSFSEMSEDVFGKEYKRFISFLIAEYNRLNSILEGHNEILEDLRVSNDSLLNTKTNDTIKRLTILTFIMFPLSLITGIFGMNASFSFIRHYGDLFMILLSFGLIALFLVLYFKHKRWL